MPTSPGPYPHDPFPPHHWLLLELNKRLAPLPKASPELLGSQGSAEQAQLGFVFISSLSQPSPMVLCSTVASVLLYLSFDDPTALCVGSPVLVLCTWASLQGLGSQPSPAPQHWNLFVFPSLGVEP